MSLSSLTRSRADYSCSHSSYSAAFSEARLTPALAFSDDAPLRIGAAQRESRSQLEAWSCFGLALPSTLCMAPVSSGYTNVRSSVTVRAHARRQKRTTARPSPLPALGGPSQRDLLSRRTEFSPQTQRRNSATVLPDAHKRAYTPSSPFAFAPAPARSRADANSSFASCRTKRTKFLPSAILVLV